MTPAFFDPRGSRQRLMDYLVRNAQQPMAAPETMMTGTRRPAVMPTPMPVMLPPTAPMPATPSNPLANFIANMNAPQPPANLGAGMPMQPVGLPPVMMPPSPDDVFANGPVTGGLTAANPNETVVTGTLRPQVMPPMPQPVLPPPPQLPPLPGMYRGGFAVKR